MRTVKELQLWQIETLQKVAALGLPLDLCADMIGISRATLYRHLNRDPALNETLVRGRADAKTSLLKTAHKMATTGENSTVLLHLLKVQVGLSEKRSDDAEAALTFKVD
jgi:predicted DNA-binding protein (UPF0251 family)